MPRLSPTDRLSVGPGVSATRPGASPFGEPRNNSSSAFNSTLGALSERSGDENSAGSDAATDKTMAKRKRRGQGGEENTTNVNDNRKRIAEGSLDQTNGGLRAKKGPNDFTRPQNGNRNPSKSNSHTDQIGQSTAYGKKIFEQLRKDGVKPPQWPSDPGNHTSKAAMAKFKEAYKSYRDRARASLIKAGLIDDPDKQKRLEDAIDFKGICEDMCPDFEKITRITEFDVKQAEKDPNSNFAMTSRMVKKLARSAAGQEAPLPMDVRSTKSLRRTLDYLVDDLLRSDDNLPVMHGFLWDRTRAIRRDFVFHTTFPHEDMMDQIYCLENIARFHVTSLHLMSQKDFAPEDFSEQQEIEQLGKALLSLMFAYDDCKPIGVKCKNEAEFRAYQLVFTANHPNALETVQREWEPRFWRESDDVRTAVSLVEALQNTQDLHGPLSKGPSLAASSAYNAYFRIVEDPKVSYTMACFAEIHFSQLRRSILETLKKAFARPRDHGKDITPSVVNAFFRFDTDEEAIEFVEQHGLEFIQDADDLNLYYLNTKNMIAYPRLRHSFSRNIVEKKRGSESLSSVMHRTVYEDASKAVSRGSNGGPTEESLFVPDAPAIKPTQTVHNASFENNRPSNSFPNSPTPLFNNQSASNVTSQLGQGTIPFSFLDYKFFRTFQNFLSKKLYHGKSPPTISRLRLALVISSDQLDSNENLQGNSRRPRVKPPAVLVSLQLFWDRWQGALNQD
jgi:nuclear mRNA export protein SAC3